MLILKATKKLKVQLKKLIKVMKCNQLTNKKTKEQKNKKIEQYRYNK